MVKATLDVVEIITAFDVGGAERLLGNRLRVWHEWRTAIRTSVLFLRGQGSLQKEYQGVASFCKVRGAARTWRAISSADVVHAHLLHAVLFAAIVCILTRKPMVLTLHNIKYRDDWRDRPIDLVLALCLWLLPEGSACIAISKAVAKHARSELGARGNLFCIPNGIPLMKCPDRLAMRERLRVPCGMRIALLVGRLEPQKRPSWALKAFAALPSRERWEVWFVGAGRLQSVLEQEAAVEGLSSQVRFWGAVTDVEKFYSCADVVLLPSSFEGFGLVAVEALRAGVPVIASNLEGPSEIVQDGVDGRLFEADSITAFASAWWEVALALPRFKKRAAASAARLDIYTIERYSEAVRTLYEGVRHAQGSTQNTRCI